MIETHICQRRADVGHHRAVATYFFSRCVLRVLCARASTADAIIEVCFHGVEITGYAENRIELRDLS
jgi:hypothetical protein